MDYRALLEVYSPGEPGGVRVYVGYISHCDKLSVQNPDCTDCTHSTIVLAQRLGKSIENLRFNDMPNI